MNPDYLTPLETVSAVRQKEGGVSFKIDSESADIHFLKSDLVRIRISQGGVFSEKPSQACIDSDWPGADFKVIQSAEKITVKSSELTITIRKKPFSLSISRKDGSPILEPRKGVPFYRYQNNHFVVDRDSKPNEHIYGLGEKTGFLDRHGRKMTLWNTDVLAPDPDKSVAELIAEKDKNPLDTDFDPYYMSIPFFYRMTNDTLTASGHFIDNPSKGTFNFDNSKNSSHIEINFNAGQYCEYFFAGPSIADILKDYSQLTGRMKIPPLWALGYHQCRWKKYSHEDLLKLAERQLNSGVSCDSLWLDIDYMDKYKVFTWNEELFPDRSTLFSRLEEMGFRIVTIVDPGIKQEDGYAIYDEAKKKSLLCKCENGQIYIGQVWPGKTAFPDFSQKACRDWWGGLNAKHVKENNISGIWNDMNEPATGAVSPRPMRFAGEQGDQSLPHEQYHNEYALLMAQATVEGLQKKNKDQRTFVLSRGGSAGIQRYAANWMGDNASRWDHLKMSLPMAMGLGLSGQPFIGADIGGFVEPTNPELFIRWMQYGALTPFCRNHNDDAVDQYVWSFGESVQKLCRDAINLRYKLLPYIYSQFFYSCKDGRPLQRPLLFDFQDDPAVRQIDDQYLFGDSILVAPILNSGVSSRLVYLPEGEWYSMTDHTVYEGKQWLTVNAPIDTIPWFIQCGVIIPMLTEVPSSTMNLHPESITLFMALPSYEEERTSWLFEDDGLTFKRHAGKCIDTRFTVNHQKGVTAVVADTAGMKYPGYKRKQFLIDIATNKKITIHSGQLPLDKTKAGYKVKNSGESMELLITEV